MWICFGKRFADIVFSGVALVALSPIMAVVALLVKLESPGDVVYKGLRSGLGGTPFNILKFRTMVADAESKGGFSTAYNDPRLTKLGRFLRRFKIDEFPQFYNVLRGDMSLVGPRPQVPAYTEKYIGEEKCILSVRPGITDFSSVHFSNLDKILGDENVDAKYLREIEPVKNKLRIKYVKELSFCTDLTLVLWTVLALLGVKRRWNI